MPLCNNPLSSPKAFGQALRHEESLHYLVEILRLLRRSQDDNVGLIFQMLIVNFLIYSLNGLFYRKLTIYMFIILCIDQ
jgi:hypothetical protein